MDNYKPYSFLNKQEIEPATLTSSFVVWVPAGKKLGNPRKTIVGNITTFTYAVLNDLNQPVARQEEYENVLSWDGNDHIVTIIIGDGSGVNGGGKSDSSALIID